MAFQKATMQQAALKVVFYGLPGTGKTFTALAVASNLGKVALIDTEHGSDFYANRWEFDVMHTRSVAEIKKVLPAYLQANPDVKSIILDSITHVWEECQAAYKASLSARGKERDIAFGDWAKIKRPYRDLMNFMLSLDRHVFLCARLGTEFETTKAGELVKAGDKIRAEADTAYEPHIIVKMSTVKGKHIAQVEKDRSGLIDGQEFVDPGVEMFRPILNLLNGHQAVYQDHREAEEKDRSLFDDDEMSDEDAARFKAIMANMKNRVGKEVYYQVLFDHDLKHCTETRSKKTAHEIHDTLKDFATGKEVVGEAAYETIIRQNMEAGTAVMMKALQEAANQ